ncbi:hypothetical protein YSY43_14760 [Paenibacillus sp. YSY-4.3]
MNNTWKDAWFIFKRDLRLDRLYLFWNVIFMIYSGAAVAILATPSNNSGAYLNPLQDFMLFVIIPITGFYFSRRSFNYLKEDTYTRMLQYYRTLPIPAITVMRGRIIQLLTATLLNGLLFYSTYYLITGFTSNWLSDVGRMITFALTWTGYLLFVNGIYIYFEFLSTGRRYLWISTLIALAAGFVAFLIHWFDGNMLAYTLEQSKRYSLLSPMMWGTLIFGGSSLALFCKITLSKMGKRDLI